VINSLSLRARLTFVILIPLLAISLLIGAWAYRDAQANAAERFDRSLLSTALAISRDVAVTGGDALKPQTRDLLRDTSGGAVFYHAYAPDGVFVTGYATPPVAPLDARLDDAQVYYDAIYQGASVRALRFTQAMSMDGVSGQFTFTVWQNTSVRDGFVQSRTRPLFLIIAAMIGALSVIVWFGVRLGLYPLLDLEDAIARRSVSDLAPIKRRIPQEVTGIVGRFNALVTELSRTLDAKDVFISDAAHQLRNPIAGVMTLGESVKNAKSLEDARERAADLLDAARDAGALADNLLTLERARATPFAERHESFEAVAAVTMIAEKFSEKASQNHIAFTTELEPITALLWGDPILFEQAVLNVLNNALLHGGEEMDRISLTVNENTDAIVIAVRDNGVGIAPVDHDVALGRFGQIGPSVGSGLGLPIAKAIAEAFGGRVELVNATNAFTVKLMFPKDQSD
jgi:two-component system sensor histidine kinase TctE